jgi:hypothetical protein
VCGVSFGIGDLLTWTSHCRQSSKKGGSTEMNRTLPNKDVDELLASFGPEVQNLALATRTFVLQLPDITDQVDLRQGSSAMATVRNTWTWSA